MMPEYRRFIAYFYEYIDGKKQRNVGFAKVELRNGIWRILFRLTAQIHPRPPVEVYGFVRQGGQVLGLPMGTMRAGREMMEDWVYQAGEKIWMNRYGMSDLAGIWIRSGDDRCFITVWDDEPVDTKLFTLEPERMPETEKEEEVHKDIVYEKVTDQQAEPGTAVWGEIDAGHGIAVQKDAKSGAGTIVPESAMSDSGISAQEDAGFGGGTGFQVKTKSGSGTATLEKSDTVQATAVRLAEETDGSRKIVGTEYEITEMGCKTADLLEAGVDDQGQIKGTVAVKLLDEVEEMEVSGSETGSSMLISGKNTVPRESMPKSDVNAVAEESMSKSGVNAVSEESILKSKVNAVSEEGMLKSDVNTVSEESMPDPDVNAVSEESMPESGVNAVSEEGMRKSDVNAVSEESMPDPDVAAVSEASMPKSGVNTVSEESMSKSGVNAVSEESMSKSGINAVSEEGMPKSCISDGTEGGIFGEKDRAAAGDGAQRHSEELQKLWNELYQRRLPFQPFADTEISSCIRVLPRDIERMQRARMRTGRNSFLLHGYHNYGHLMIGVMEDGRHVLGVPGIMNPQEKYMAGMFGFPYFKYVDAPEQTQASGYWCRILESV